MLHSMAPMCWKFSPVQSGFKGSACSYGMFDNDVDLQLREFWFTINERPEEHARYVAYFRRLLVPAALRAGKRRVLVFAVFGKLPSEEERAQPDTLLVQWSGENWSRTFDPALFDLNLIPAIRSIGVVPHPLAALNIECDYLGHLPKTLLDRLFLGRSYEARAHRPGHEVAIVVSNTLQCPRTRFFRRLSAVMPVHAMGRGLNNTGWLPPAPHSTAKYIEFLGSWRFCIAMENASDDYYLTEKLLNAYMAGCVPIYWGCPQVQQILNPDAFVHLDARDPTDADLDALVRRVQALATDEAAYRKMFEAPLFRGGVLPPELDPECIAAQCKDVISQERSKPLQIRP